MKFRLFKKSQDPYAQIDEWVLAADRAEDRTRGMPDVELRQAFDGLGQRHRNGENLDALLPEAFAVVREAAVRTLGAPPFPEQFVAGAALHVGSVVQLATGDGRPMAVVLAACLHSLAGRGVHIMTANDFLAANDADRARPLYSFLGMQCAVLAKENYRHERQAIYRADIVYGTPDEFAHDYLRDNLETVPTDVVQRGLFSAIVDEADLAMIEEGRNESRISTGYGCPPGEKRTLAVIGRSAFLRLYPRLAASVEVLGDGGAAAYYTLYGLSILRIPPRRTVRRIDHDPVVYRDDDAMLRAVDKAVEDKRSTGNPVLICAPSGEMAGAVSRRLRAAAIDHDLLAATDHLTDAAKLVHNAGRPGAVTVLAPEAGRGVVVRAEQREGPGVFVLGVGPLVSHRFEDRMRVRAGQNGDPGESAFFLSMDDPRPLLSAPFDRLDATGDPDGPVGGPSVTQSVAAILDEVQARETAWLERAQRHEAVREEHRAAVYARRSQVLMNGITLEETARIIEKVTLARGTEAPEGFAAKALAASAAREAELGPETAAWARLMGMLTAIDTQWQRLLHELERAYAALDLRATDDSGALAEYRDTASRLAAAMWATIDEQFLHHWFHAEVTTVSGE